MDFITKQNILNRTIQLTVPAAVLEDRNVFAFNLERPKSQTCRIGEEKT